jgi:hypothetical protein
VGTAAATLHLLDKIGLGGGGEEGNGGEGADDTVVVDVRPNGHRVTEAEKNEGQNSEGQDDLRGKPANDVVIALVGCGLAAIRGEEEGTDVAAEI